MTGLKNRQALVVRVVTLFAIASASVVSPIRAAEPPILLHALKPPVPPAWAEERVPVRSSDSLSGLASWYGEPYHGRPTASGEVYDMHELTAAHPTLAFDSRLLVKNLANGKRVQVRINDRGPFVPGRIIDVSYAAALELGMIGRGLTRVQLIPLR